MNPWPTRSYQQRVRDGTGTCRSLAPWPTSTAPAAGSIGLPARLFWSGPRPREVRWNLADRDRRRDLYEIVLVEGTLDDIVQLIDGKSLVEVWDQMYLPQRVRAAWLPLIDNARSAA